MSEATGEAPDTRFRVRSGFLARYPVQTAGARMRQELWLPAEELDELNANIVGPIELTAKFHGAPPPASRT